MAAPNLGAGRCVNPGILFGLAAGTLVSEDLTSISAGLLVRDDVVDLLPAIAACMAGVYLGDLGLWAVGRVAGRRVLQWAWVQRRIDPSVVATLGTHLDRRLGVAVLGSRFLPGSRLPMYLALGISGRRSWAFAAWSLIAVLLWTPSLVWLTRTCGSALSMFLLGELNTGLRYLVSAVVMWTAWRLIARVVSSGMPSRS
jgi:membrane protein DedA with SNARE-associated domain